MGKKTNETSKNAAEKPVEPAPKKTKRASGTAKAKDKSTLTEKAVKAVAAVALGVGSAIAAKRKKRPANTKSASKPPKAAAQVPEEPPRRATYSNEDIALRAYFISEARRKAGQPGDPHQDWLQAEQELSRDSQGQHS